MGRGMSLFWKDTPRSEDQLPKAESTKYSRTWLETHGRKASSGTHEMWGIICLPSVRQLEQDLLTTLRAMPAGQPCGQRLMLHQQGPSQLAPSMLSLGLTSDFSTSSAGPSGSHRVPPSPPYSRTLLNSTILPPLLVHWTSYQQVPALPRRLPLEIFKVGLIKFLEGDPSSVGSDCSWRAGRTAA